MIGPVQALKYAGIAIVALGGLTGVLYVGGVVGVPDAGLEGNEWGAVEEDRIEVLTTVRVHNPNPVGGGVDRVEYDLAMNDVHLASGGTDDVAVESGNNTLTFGTDVNHTRIPAWWAAHLEGTEDRSEVSQLDVTATVYVSAAGRTFERSVPYEDDIETDVEGMIADALSELEGEYTGTEGDVSVGGQPIEPTVEVRDTDAEWGEVTEDETELLATFHVHNPNAYPIPVPGFAGEFEMNDRDVLQWDASDVDVVEGPTDGVIPPKTTEEVVLRVDLDNERFADWFASHVDNDEYTNATLRAHLAVDVSGSEVRMPQDGEAVRCDYDLTTAIFVDQESGLERRDCQFTPWTSTRSDLEDAGATLDLTETDWWAEQRDGSGSDGGDDGSTDDGSGDDGDGDLLA